MATALHARNAAIKSLADNSMLGQDQQLAGILNLDVIEARIADLNNAFAGVDSALHTVACKAVTIIPVLRFLAERGMGCEVASPGEFAMAKAAGFAPEKIVVDSPAKTRAELREALELGASLNIDSYQEMGRVAALRDELAESGVGPTTSHIGVRVNPVVGAGSIGQMSTATTTTKFGIALYDEDSRERLVAAIVARPWIRQLHVHTGSQGIPLELAATGIKTVVGLASEINTRAGRDQIARLDVGGGLSVNFPSEDVLPTFHDYADVLKREVPELFNGDFQIVTEFGRSVLAKAGDIATLIEYTKDVGPRRFAIGHAGAQTATRTVFVPEHWPLRISAYTADGSPSQAPHTVQDLAGPCCFTGDMIGRDYDVPEFAPGDIAVVHDTGAYYFSTPFAYNALPRPAVYAYRTRPVAAGVAEASAQGAAAAGAGEELEVEWTLVRAQQTLAELLAEAGEDVTLS